MNRSLRIERNNRLLADMRFTYETPLRGLVTLAFYRPAEGDFGELDPPLMPDYAVQAAVLHEHPLSSWAETLAYDQNLFRQQLQVLSLTDIPVDELTWQYSRLPHLSRYLVLNSEGQTTGIIDAEWGLDGYYIRLRSLLGTTQDFEWFTLAGYGDGVQQLFEDGKLGDAKEIRNVGW